MREVKRDLLAKERRTAYSLLFPSLVILFVIMIYPLGSVIWTSLTDKTFASSEPTRFVGLVNYSKLLSLTVRELPNVEGGNAGARAYAAPTEVLPRKPLRYKELFLFQIGARRYVVGATDPRFIEAAGDTIAFTLVSVLLETLLGLVMALFLDSGFRGRGVMRVAMLLPWAIPTAVSSKMWEWMLGSTRTGFFNVFFQAVFHTDGQFAFLTDPSTQLWAMVAIDVWKTTPYMALLILAGLQMIPSSLYEVARVDGATWWRQFRTVTMPMLRPALLVAVVFRSLDALRVFDLFQIVFGSKRYSLSSFAYYQLIDNKAMGYSSASSVLIFFLLLVVSVLYMRLLGGKEDED